MLKKENYTTMLSTLIQNFNYTLFRFLYPLPVLLFILSCSEEPKIESFSIPSEYDGPIVSWKLPPNWGENPDLSGPMAGSFHVKTKSGPQGRIGVMPFRENVSTVDVANMFGREMGYPPFNQENLTPFLQEKKIGDRIFEWVYLNSKVETASSPPRTALLALLRQDKDTWLFPFIADQKLVLKESENFIQFLESCSLRSEKNKPILARLPAPLPKTGNTNSAKPPKNPWSWSKPSTWSEGKASSMRIGSYKVAGPNGTQLDISVTSFPGDVGGLLANVNRWIGQIDLAPIQEASLDQYCSSITLAGNSAHLVEAYGEEKAVLAGTLFLEKESWFFKLIGNRTLAEKEKSNFISFLNSISLQGETE